MSNLQEILPEHDQDLWKTDNPAGDNQCTQRPGHRILPATLIYGNQCNQLFCVLLTEETCLTDEDQ
jgi:hypothetical protein